ncbi:TIGR03668 family PPOX class F420-dependent oxidoreductase [Streptomyces sp. NPDC054766]|uniref:TIGR03668 family PPOX class F420-dependent oxidoreductase n=1 Tax=Streptomyces rhizosphaerihabitans TaxID=1266770 RepID=UPI0021BEEB1F|nr:TIGR03668 family PPOX class F420-dependent oxidoreductase [Streptomyces rhizosphaerihabitans]MCT9008962.1 TIGR03668 family PPOX class F420-dependent oxidoreductase [Streptomyces rhizosphaerihabitans]
MPDMDENQARRRFLAARVATLATVDAEGRPHLVPLVFARCGDELVTAVDHKPKRSPLLRRLRNIAARPAVCLLVDAYDEDWERLWWVRADGEARIVPPPDGRERGEVAHAYAAAVDALRDKYPQYRNRPPDGPVTVITVHRWRGWQAAPEP